MQTRYEFFDHTADIGIRVFAATLAGLVQPAGQALYEVIGDLTPVGESEPLRLSFSGDEPALLLRDYLAELLRRFETDGQIVTQVGVEEFDDARLTVAARLCRVDRRRSALEREVKAVTYHELAIRRAADGYEATCIVDI
jgi:SHS2 domain-containing protein